MSSGMPELGSKISLISKADIRYEGRLFTVDPQECTIALASVRSFGTEDRETQYPVAPQSQVYDYILFRGSDIKDIRVLNNVPSLPNDPAIMQMSVPPSLGGGPAAPGPFTGQFTHPVVGQTQYPQYHPMAGFPGGVHAQLNKTSSMLDLISGGGQNASRSGTPAVGGHRKSPTADQGTQSVNQVGQASGSGQQRDSRRGSTGANGQKPRNRTNSRNRQRYPSGGPPPQQQQNPQPHQQHQQQHQHPGQHQGQHQGPHHQPGGYNNEGGYRGGWRGRGGRGGGQRGNGRGFVPRNKNTLKFDNDYDFEQANTEFEELRSQLAKAKISDAEPKIEVCNVEQLVQVETEKKDDSGNETGAGEAGEEDEVSGYDKNKSFFDNISCEAVERSKGRSQRTDWRTERKLNSETFGVALARRGAWRGRGGYRHHNPHQQHPNNYNTFYESLYKQQQLNSETFGVALARRGAWRGRGGYRHHNPHQQHPNNYNTFYANNYSWRPMRGGRGRPQHQGFNQQHNNNSQQHNNRTPRPHIQQPAAVAPQQQSQPAAAK
ncbi:hypothetical protein O0L34_g16717 [Tuta absoluta]|nr:hypothetical protein O0L34_g16717 [Tuta absoluta]KAJ2943609.1 hypothetical protein O0L34_g16717 [Tuta absoluta]